MTPNTKRVLSIGAVLMMVVGGCTTLPPPEAAPPLETALMARIKNTTIDTFVLPAPEEETLSAYLGIPAGLDFRLPQIETDILLIEVFSFYCPHCQKEAPHVNELYRIIEADSSLRGRIKIIGIGVSNSPFEVNQWKEKYDVPFPLFSDKDLAIHEKLGTELTPTFLGIRFLDDGTYVVFHFRAGALGDLPGFLDTILLKSQLKGR